MKSYRILAAAAAFMLLASCGGNKATLNCTVSDSPSQAFVLKRLNGNVTEVIDTVRTDAACAFKYKVALPDGSPEFVYVYKGDLRLASLLLASGDAAEVVADTLGNYSVSGSEGSVLLKEGDDAFRTFVGNLASMSASGAAPAEVGREYVRHYRESVRFVMNNAKSLAVIPVLYEKVGEMPTFGNLTDAFLFRSVCDSLKAVYPDSKYVKALEQETVRRENMFSISNSISAAEQIAYPNLAMPSIDGSAVELSGLESKLTLLYFWNSDDATHKMFNQDVLKPLYAQYHPRGLEIYAICVDPDKASWGRIVKDQQLPWINVNDGFGTASRSLYLYNVQRVPACILVSDAGINPVPVREADLRRAVEKGLK